MICRLLPKYWNTLHPSQRGDGKRIHHLINKRGERSLYRDDFNMIEAKIYPTKINPHNESRTWLSMIRQGLLKDI